MVNYLVMFTLPHHQYPAVRYILTHLVNWAFGPKSGFKIKCRDRAGFGLQNETRAQLCSAVSDLEPRRLVEEMPTTSGEYRLAFSTSPCSFPSSSVVFQFPITVLTCDEIAVYT